MRLDNLLAQEKNQPKGHETSLTQRGHSRQWLPSPLPSPNIDTGLQNSFSGPNHSSASAHLIFYAFHKPTVSANKDKKLPTVMDLFRLTSSLTSFLMPSADWTERYTELLLLTDNGPLPNPPSPISCR